ncbi:response regulator [Ancylomarina sp.]|uniref:response regulator n=1 Tax=Ancylomarina sp. TaxID=1970196 RepID=UPI00356999E8
MQTILLVDDHEIIIDGIKAMLAKEKNIKIVGEANNGVEAIAKVQSLKPDIVLMDISMPELNGIEATKSIKKEYQDTKILMLTQHESKEYVLQVMKAGADGYLLKNSKKEELLNAINTVTLGKKHLCNRISALMLDEILDDSVKDNGNEKPEQNLTKREIEIIKLLANDLSNHQVSDELSISLRTVETHRRNLMQKLNLKSAVALVRFAIKHNMIDL